jgi:hypothetical protein
MAKPSFCLRKSAFYEQVGEVKGVFVLFFILSLSLLWSLWLCRVVVLHRVSIRTLSEPFVAPCRLGSEGEVDAASFRTAL